MDGSTWLTYAQMGEIMGITPASAKRLAIRRRWAKKQGNDGQALVCVPNDRLQVPDKPKTNTSDDTGAITGDARALIAHLEARVTQLTGDNAALVSELGELRHKVEAVTAEFRDALSQAKTEAAVTNVQLDAERRRAAEIESDRDQWRAHASRPWWRRLVR